MRTRVQKIFLQTIKISKQAKKNKQTNKKTNKIKQKKC